MVGATTVYFSPDWPRRLVNFFKKKGKEWRMILPAKELMLAPTTHLTPKQKAILFALVVWVGIQVLVPLRHLVYPGNVHWTEEGHKYAWHMKLRTKRGQGIYTIKDKNTGQKQVIDADDYLKKWQQTKMEGNPDLIWQFCKIIKNDYKKKGFDVAVYANVKATLNGRKFQQLIDSTVDLASMRRPVFAPASWIIPLQTPLDDRLKK